MENTFNHAADTGNDADSRRGYALTPVKSLFTDVNVTEVSGAPLVDDVFVKRTANQLMADAANRPDPKSLWSTLWFENEVSCLFADSNRGKSLFAVQIAEHIARDLGRKVLYFDFELTDKQFQLRYTDDDGRRYHFPDNLIVVQPTQVALPETVFEMVGLIKQMALKEQCKIIIIDNITWMCNQCESGDAAGELMQLLVGLKRDCGFSILCLAHTPKRSISAPLTQNSLAGSKRIANFMDSMFAIGLDRTNLPAGRYVKQIKVRNDECRYGEDNVIRLVVDKRDGMLGLWSNGYGVEQELLDTPDAEYNPKKDEIKRMIKEGVGYAEISRQLKVSKCTISKCRKEMDPDE